MQLTNLGQIVVHLDEAIVRGRKLSTIWNDVLLPTGYAHSLNWIQEGGFTPSRDGMRCAWPPTDVVDLSDDQPTCLIGMTAHFGHFFTDALDRIFSFEHAGLAGSVRYLVDGTPPPQVTELLDLIGAPCTPSNMVSLDPRADYRVRNLYVASLGAAKPAITTASFEKLRERVLGRIPNPLPSNRMVYVGRKLVPQRKVRNQEELDQSLAAMGFDIFYPELHSIEEAVGAFHGADVIAFVIGSSKFNLAFCRPGTKIICISPEGYAEQGGPVATMTRQLCGMFSLELCFCSCKIAGTMLAINSDIVIEPRELGQALRALST
jgi:capsular polysaccharide biosynthesis protein